MDQYWGSCIKTLLTDKNSRMPLLQQILYLGSPQLSSVLRGYGTSMLPHLGQVLYASDTWVTKSSSEKRKRKRKKKPVNLEIKRKCITTYPMSGKKRAPPAFIGETKELHWIYNSPTHRDDKIITKFNVTFEANKLAVLLTYAQFLIYCILSSQLNLIMCLHWSINHIVEFIHARKK